MTVRKAGDSVPRITFRTRQNGEWVDVTSDELFAGRKVVLFALPGAFTPTCSSTHLPRYNELAPEFRRHGIDDIICLSVNDGFVMEAWQKDQKAENVTFIPDGNGEFSAAMGMLVDKADLGFGDRSWRYSMLVNDGIIEKMFVEPDLPGDPFEVSDADTMLGYLAPEVRTAHRITLVSRPGCGYCVKARDLLNAVGQGYEEIEIGSHGVTTASLQALSGAATTPQVFIDGECIGGSEALEHWCRQQSSRAA